MKVFNKLSPNDEQLNGFVEGDVETPIAMVNLLKFKEKAEYEDGRDTNPVSYTHLTLPTT